MVLCTAEQAWQPRSKAHLFSPDSGLFGTGAVGQKYIQATMLLNGTIDRGQLPFPTLPFLLATRPREFLQTWCSSYRENATVAGKVAVNQCLFRWKNFLARTPALPCTQWLCWCLYKLAFPVNFSRCID